MLEFLRTAVTDSTEMTLISVCVNADCERGPHLYMVADTISHKVCFVWQEASEDKLHMGVFVLFFFYTIFTMSLAYIMQNSHPRPYIINK